MDKTVILFYIMWLFAKYPLIITLPKIFMEIHLGRNPKLTVSFSFILQTENTMKIYYLWILGKSMT